MYRQLQCVVRLNQLNETKGIKINIIVDVWLSIVLYVSTEKIYHITCTYNICTGAYVRNFWLDGNDLERKGHYVWSSTRQPMSYRNWNSLEPSGGSEDCVEMLTHEFADIHTRGKWNDRSCSHANHYICEIRF